MPSSLIFVGLVVLWLLILVPTVARRQQEVARLSPALLSGRVLERPMRHRFPEVGVMERLDDRGATTVGELVERRDDVPAPRDRDSADDRPDLRDEDLRDEDLRDDLEQELDDELVPDSEAELDLGVERDVHDLGDGHDVHDEDDRQWERPPARYRPGRGGYDPEAAAVAAHAKYAFRQRVVLGLLVLLLASVAAALLVTGLFWWATGVLGAGLAGYLTYLRRQVRIEEAIRDRRAARLAGTRRSAAADDPELDDWARRGREAGLVDQDDVHEAAGNVDAVEETALDDDQDHDDDWTADDGEPSRIRGTGEPLGVLPARRRTTDGAGGDEPESSLPRLSAAPPPPIPAGTSLVDVDDEEQLDAVPTLDIAPTPGSALDTDTDDTAGPMIEHRRAVGE
ncbi:gephyrin-like molybdotransferase receptor GlpR [Pseudonocardia sp. KRD291]|uniref:divisome protein SepX/GlpR n=1 Tax=Pseudonocardia sp. KRD291 TaxID=2792007 RepID=UPI001C4A230A|nr:gephyrin-like molybdotransferase receptor GlpR [Pseudonocardia sp. KRD291]MBW0101446.1 hypothetical protein [Pseudonocardia sp. KRD291]